MLPVIAGMLAISTFVVGTTYIILLVPKGILIFRLSNILNLHIYQGYTSLYGSLHDFITNVNHSLLTLIKHTAQNKLSHFTENKHYIDKIKMINKCDWKCQKPFCMTKYHRSDNILKYQKVPLECSTWML